MRHVLFVDIDGVLHRGNAYAVGGLLTRCGQRNRYFEQAVAVH